MGNFNAAEDERTAAERRAGLLYPLLLIAATAVIIFSVAATATLMGWIPDTLSRAQPAAKSTTAPGRISARPSLATGGCPDCGVVESVRAVEVKGLGTGLGAVAGGLVGGLLGHQLGPGNGRAAATLVGFGAGAYAGHEIEKSAKNFMSYQVRVRMTDGTRRTFYERAQPAIDIGQYVRVTERGAISAG
jgi:outer membrane lipoprotein SlyB